MANRSRSELKRLARGFLLGNYTVPILAVLTVSFLPAVLLTPFSVGVSAELNFGTITYGIAAVIIKILAQLLAVGVMRMHLLLAQNQQVSYKDLFWTFRNQPDRFILATLLLVVILCIPAVPVALGVFALAGSGSAAGYLLMAGMILAFAVIDLYLAYMFDLIYLLYIDRPEMTVLEGFRRSVILMRGNKKRLFVLQLSFLGWQMLGLCSLGIGMLWIQPYISQTVVNFYLDLTGELEKNSNVLT